jgi:hypothetical protein
MLKLSQDACYICEVKEWTQKEMTWFDMPAMAPTSCSSGSAYTLREGITPSTESTTEVAPTRLCQGKPSLQSSPASFTSEIANGCGVAFLDDSKISLTIDRMHLITSEQFEEARRQEGSHWYDKTVHWQRERLSHIRVHAFIQIP